MIWSHFPHLLGAFWTLAMLALTYAYKLNGWQAFGAPPNKQRWLAKMEGKCNPPATISATVDQMIAKVAAETLAMWEDGHSAFWLDPDLWTGVGDTHRDMCWLHLDERRKPALARLEDEVLSWTPTSTETRRARDVALHLLKQANDYENRGFGAMANKIRDEAMARLREVLNAEKFAKQLTRPGAIIRIPGNGGPTPVGVNGKVTVVLHGVDVLVPPHILAALRNSNVQFELRTPMITGARR